MNLPDYIYDPITRRYYRNQPSTSSSYINLPRNDSRNSEDRQVQLEKKIICSIDVLKNFEMGYIPRPKFIPFFNGYDSIIASRFTTAKYKFHRNIFLKDLDDYHGLRLFEPYCSYLVGCPEEDLIIGVWTNEYAVSIAYIDVKNLLTPEKVEHKIVPSYCIYNETNHFMVEQLLMVVLKKNSSSRSARKVILFCLVKSFNIDRDLASLIVYFMPRSNELNLMNITNSVYQFKEPYFSCDFCEHTYKLAVGGESKIKFYNLTARNHSFELLNDCIIELKRQCIVLCLKFDKTGSRLFCGTNKGEIHIIYFDRKDKFEIINLNCGSIVDLDLFSEHELIVSAHGHFLYKLYITYCGKINNLIRFDGHFNECRRIRFTIDRVFNTLTACGQDNCIRIWSLNTCELIRIIDFKEIVHRIKKNEFTDSSLLDEDFRQICVIDETPFKCKHPLDPLSLQKESAIQVSSTCLKYYTDKLDEQYQVISSSKWKCLNNKPQNLMLGSISDSIDLFF